MNFLSNGAPNPSAQSTLVPFNDTGADSLVAVLTILFAISSNCATFSVKLPSVVGSVCLSSKIVCPSFPFILHLTDPVPTVTQVNTSSSPGHTIEGDCSYVKAITT